MSITGEAPPSTSAAFDEAKAAGNASFASGDYEAALAHYAAATAANSSSPIPHSNSALVLLRLSRPFDAVRAASTALELLALHPDRSGSLTLSIKALLRRATARTALNDFALAEHDLREILVLEPGHEEATTKLRELHAAGHISLASGNRSEGPTTSAAPRIVEVAEDRSSRPSVHRPVTADRVQQGSAIPNGHPEKFHVGAASKPLTASFDGSIQAMSAREALMRPRGSADFERSWRTLACRPVLRGRYIALTVGAEALEGGILGQTITSALIREICEGLVAAMEEEKSVATESVKVLSALSTVPRFDLAIMFLSDAEKTSVRSVFDAVERQGEAASTAVIRKYSV